MAFSGRAWTVTGSKTPANIARMVAYAATSGGNGVGGLGHLRVTATAVPSAQVTILPGIAVMRSRYPGASLETYIDYNDGAFSWPIAPTGSSGGRTDYLVIRVHDPAFLGEPAPADPLVGPYTALEVLTTDPRVAPPSFPFVLLAKITIPKSTGTITPDMIDTGASVREMANPRSKAFARMWNGRQDGATTNKQYELTSTTGQLWLPTAVTGNVLRVEIPEWAGQLDLSWTIGQLFQYAKDCWGWVKIRIWLSDAQYYDTWEVHFDTSTDAASPQWSRESWSGAGRVGIPDWARGKTVELRVVAAKSGGNTTGAKFYLGAGSSVSLQGIFSESEIDDTL